MAQYGTIAARSPHVIYIGLDPRGLAGLLGFGLVVFALWRLVDYQGPVVLLVSFPISVIPFAVIRWRRGHSSRLPDLVLVACLMAGSLFFGSCIAGAIWLVNHWSWRVAGVFAFLAFALPAGWWSIYVLFFKRR